MKMFGWMDITSAHLRWQRKPVHPSAHVHCAFLGGCTVQHVAPLKHGPSKQEYNPEQKVEYNELDSILVQRPEPNKLDAPLPEV